jgi:predicted phosphodiesterase
VRLAVFGDIHGNSVALDAVLDDIASIGGVDRYWVLGDLVAIGPDPRGVLERLRSLESSEFIRGNTDRYIVDAALPFADGEATFAWAHGAVVAIGAFEWLAGLPLEMRSVTASGTRLLGVHASPGRDDGPGLRPTHSDDELRSRFGGCDADIVFVGHTHVTTDRTVDGVRLVNPGSVSNHPPGERDAKWVLVESDEHRTDLTFRSVPYDRWAAITQLHDARHPGADYIAGMLRD